EMRPVNRLMRALMRTSPSADIPAIWATSSASESFVRMESAIARRRRRLRCARASAIRARTFARRLVRWARPDPAEPAPSVSATPVTNAAAHHPRVSDHRGETMKKLYFVLGVSLFGCGTDSNSGPELLPGLEEELESAPE